MRLLTARLTDTQNWTAAAVKTSWYQYALDAPPRAKPEYRCAICFALRNRGESRVHDLGNRISAVDRDKSAVGYAHDLQNRLTTHAGQTQKHYVAGRLALTSSGSAAVSSPALAPAAPTDSPSP